MQHFSIASWSAEGCGNSREASSSEGVCGSTESSYADLGRFDEELSVEDAARLTPELVESDVRWALHAARRDLAALGSDRAVAMVGRSEAAISDMLNRNQRRDEERGRRRVPAQICRLKSLDSSHCRHHI